MMTIKGKRKFLPLFLVYLAPLNTALSADPSTPPKRQLLSIPQAVKTFIAAAQQDAENNLPKLKQDEGNDFELDFHYLFFTPAIDFRDGKSPAYLVGFSLGTRPGSGLIPFNKTSLIDAQGKQIVDLGDTGDSAIVVQLKPGLEVAAFSGDEGRPHRGFYQIFSLEKEPKLLLDYRSPETQLWESTFFFVDTRNRGTKDILVRRIVRNHDKNAKWTEYVLLQLTPQSSMFTEAQPLTKSRFDELIQKAGGEDHIPHSEQTCLYDADWDAKLRIVQCLDQN